VDNNQAISRAGNSLETSQETGMIMERMDLHAIAAIAVMDNAAAAIRMAKDRGKARDSPEDRGKVNRGKEANLDRAKGKDNKAAADVVGMMAADIAMSVVVALISSDWAEQ
jgi:hypothetical protein